MAALLLFRGNMSLDEVLDTEELITYSLIFGAAVVVYLYWRMTADDALGPDEKRLSGWLAIGLFMAALTVLVQAGLHGSNPTIEPNAWTSAGRLVLLMSLIGVVRASATLRVPGDPALVGALGGILVAGGTHTAVIMAPAVAPTGVAGSALSAFELLSGLLLARMLWRHDQIAARLRQQLALVAVILTTSHTFGAAATTGTEIVLVAVLAAFQSAVVLCTLGEAFVDPSRRRHRGDLEVLEKELASASADILENRELLHEVGSTIAGISAATRVIRRGVSLPPPVRVHLEWMLAAEVARLERLLNSRDSSTSRCFAIDDVVDPLVTSHQLRGLDVHWIPTGHLVVGDPDALAEVVNILLDNAHCHGTGAVRLVVTAVGTWVEIACSDEGPGVAEEVLGRLFAPGASRSDSPGQGLGLSIAARLMAECGGSLELVESEHPGARFVARLQAGAPARVAPANVA